MKATLEAIEVCLQTLLPAETMWRTGLAEAAQYALLGHGKRFRPRICLAIALQLGASIESALQPACALEMVHAYSLVHDDLPCMDDSDLRRGRASLHRAFSEAQAVLTGDLLLTLAFQTLAESPGLSDPQRVRLVQLLATRSGLSGMIGGQAMDIAFEGKSVAPAALQQMQRKKTGALIAVSLEFGGIIADVDECLLQELRLLGEEAGRAFQIVDDLLDAQSTSEQVGKPVRADAIKEKASLVRVMGAEHSKVTLERLRTSCEQRLTDLPGDSEELSHLLSQLFDRERYSDRKFASTNAHCS